jgi:hypothetical protein
VNAIRLKARSELITETIDPCLSYLGTSP